MNTENIKQENDNIVSNEHILIKQFNKFNIEIYGTSQEPLFKAKDIGELLGIVKITKTIEKLDDGCRVLKVSPSRGGLQEQWFLTEEGLYEVLFISRKPIAKQRIQGLQTACIDDIKVIFSYKTCNAKLLETNIHYILDRYRTNHNREHFRVNLDYAKTIINIVGKIINTCKRTWQSL